MYQKIKELALANDKGLTANQYQTAALRTANTLDMDALLLNGVMGLAGEAGECVDLMKKHLFQCHPLDREKLKLELGDVAWYLAITAKAAGFDLSEVFCQNILKLFDRYPDGFDPERSINRTEGSHE